MAVNSDDEKLALAEIGYMDLDRAVHLYLLDYPGEKSAPIAELLKPENHYLSRDEINDYKERLEEFGYLNNKSMQSWRIAAVHDTNDENGFYACAVETSQHPPEVTLAFRGSGELLDPHDFQTDWNDADFALVKSTKTVQEAEAEKFMIELNKSGFFDQYEGINFAGHSLGGALADYSCIASYYLGISDKVTGCYNLDGPGHGTAFIKENKEAIEHVGGKMDHYVWSTVGTQLHDIEGVHQHYVDVETKYTDTDEWKGIIDKGEVLLGLKQHAREATVRNDGQFNTISKEQFLEHHHLFNGGLSCFMSDVSAIPVIGPAISFSLKVSAEMILSNIPVVGTIYKAYKLYCLGKKLIDLFTGGGEEEETPEEKAKREASEAAAKECDQYIGFEIDPAAFLNISSNLANETGTRARELKHRVLEIRDAFFSNIDNTMLFATMLTTGSFDTSAIYNNAELVNLKTQIRDQMSVVSKMKRSATACESVIIQIQETIAGMISYLSETGTAFQNIEKDAQARAASWPK